MFILLLSSAFSSQVMAQNFKLPAFPAGTVQCDLSKVINGSAKMTEVMKKAVQVAVCTDGANKYELAFIGVGFPSAQAGETQFVIRCSIANVAGAYFYGGMPLGFETSSYRHEPWFANAETGRCTLKGNENLLRGIVAQANRSAMVILPLATQ